MNIIWSIAVITFKEGLRHRLLIGVILSALLVIFFSVFVSGLFMRDILKILLDISMSAVSFGGLLVPIFLAVSLLAGDIEKKTIFTILAKPFTRKQYLLGKFTGFSLLTGCNILILTFAAFLAIYIARTIYPPAFFITLKIAPIIKCSFLIFCSALILNSCVVLWCCLTTSSLLATLLTLCTYIIGQSVEDIVRFITLRAEGVQIPPFIEYVTNFTLYFFPNLARFDFKTYASHGLPIPTNELLTLVVYTVTYSCVILSLAVFFFRKRDLA